MAAEITHIVFAEKTYQKYFADKVKKDFFIGCCFPDIRYVAKSQRSHTHLQEVTLVDVQQETNSFQSGIKFHCLVDLNRDRYLEKYQSIFKKYLQEYFFGGSLKLLEDEMYYEKIDSWSETNDCFSNIVSDEHKTGFSMDDINKYHQILTKYFTQKPDDGSRQDLLVSFGFDQEAINHCAEIIFRLKKDKKVISLVKKMYDDIEVIINK